MSLRRLLGVILLVIGTSLGLVGPAVAAPYGPRTGSAAVSSTRVVQGQSVRVSGDSFCPSTTVRVTVTRGGHIVLRTSIQATSTGAASTRVRLSTLGRNTIALSGCFKPALQNQVLTARVIVVPHNGSARVNDNKVNRGDRVTVSASGFRNNAKILVRVYDDGHGYQAKNIHATRSGNASTSVKLTRSGRTTITLQGFAKTGGLARTGGTVLKTTHVTVRNARSFSGSTAAFAQNTVGSVSTGGYALAGGLLLLFGATQVMSARRRRSS